MSLTKITELCLILSLMLCFAGSFSVAIMADEQRSISDRKRGCKDYDREASTDEEKSSADCNGTVPTPEPVSIILFTAGLAGVGFAARRRLRRRSE